VLGKIVTNTLNIRSNFHFIGKPDTRNLTKR